MSDVQVQPSPLGQTIYVPVGGARPTLGVTHLKAGLWITGFAGSGTLKNRLGVRTCATEEGAYGPWTALESGWTDTTADGVCGLAIPDAGERCRVSYLTENTFRWAICKRYGDAQRASCCGKFYDGDPDERLNPAMGGRESAVNDAFFMNDMVVYLLCPS